jgi:formylmethanofuran dehydrogenase subunit C
LSLELHLNDSEALSIDLGRVDFDWLCSQPAERVRRIAIMRDGVATALGDCFQVRGHAEPTICRLMGDCCRVDGIGTNLRGVSIEICGGAGHRLGTDMRGGAIKVAGPAGDFVGGPSRGRRSGMRGGVISIDGNSGRFTGFRLRRGTIVVAGTADAALGAEMIAGTIAVGAASADGFGQSMRRGTIICVDRPKADPEWETLRFSSPHPTPTVFHRLITGALATIPAGQDIAARLSASSPAWRRRYGDLAVGGIGEVWLGPGKD